MTCDLVAISFRRNIRSDLRDAHLNGYIQPLNTFSLMSFDLIFELPQPLIYFLIMITNQILIPAKLYLMGFWGFGVLGWAGGCGD